MAGGVSFSWIWSLRVVGGPLLAVCGGVPFPRGGVLLASGPKERDRGRHQERALKKMCGGSLGALSSRGH